jgi:hypothetical protein
MEYYFDRIPDELIMKLYFILKVNSSGLSKISSRYDILYLKYLNIISLGLFDPLEMFKFINTSENLLRRRRVYK